MGSRQLIGSGSSFGVPALPRKALTIIVALVLVGTALLVIATRPEGRTTPAVYLDRVAARVDRIEPCPPEAPEALLGAGRAMLCHQVLVEALEGPDAGQLLALAPVYGERGTTESPPFVDNQLIHIRGLEGPTGTTYHFVGQPRSAALFFVLAILGVVILIAGHRAGIQLLLLVAATLLILTWHTVPALAGLQPSAFPADLTILSALLLILALGLLLDGPLLIPSQLSFLASGLSITVAIAAGRLLVDTVVSNDPVSAEVLLLNPLGEGSSLEGFVLLALSVGAVFAISRSSRVHVETVLAYERHSGGTTAMLTQLGYTPWSRSSVLFASLNRCRPEATSGLGVFLFASLSGSIPLLLLFGADGVPASQALNNQLLAATAVRITAGAIALALAGPVATGLTVLVVPLRSPADRSGVIHEPRPPIRRHGLGEDEVIVDLNPKAEPVDQPLTRRLRVGIED